MRVLIVSPHFPPTNAADMQRVRLILPYLEEAGAEVEVLSVEAEQVAAPQDAWLAAGLPPEVPIHRVTALGLKWSRVPGLGTLGFRALRAIRREGDELLDGGLVRSAIRGEWSGFDLVYFSTTQFGIHVLGPEWKRKFGVPFVMDYQDPWVSDYYREHPEVTPPGGRLKYGLASWMSRRQEPRVLRHCSGITSVSAAYPEQLAKRYRWLRVEEFLPAKAQRTPSDAGIEGHGGGLNSPIAGHGGSTAGRGLPSSWAAGVMRLERAGSTLPALTLPFPGDVWDFERVRAEGVRQSVFDPGDGLKHWVYVGRGGADMALAVRGLFSALSATLNSQPSTLDSQLSPLNSLRLHFIGTSYAAAGRGVKTIEPLAADYGLEGIVVEHPDRIPYSQTLRCLLDADALIVPGSDDPGYTASKIYPYLLAEKPLLAVFHEQSSVVELIRKVGGGRVIPFSTDESPEELAGKISREWLDTGGPEQALPLDPEAFAPFSARAQAAKLVGFWRNCVGSGPGDKASGSGCRHSISHQVFGFPIRRISRRWRQVGGPYPLKHPTRMSSHSETLETSQVRPSSSRPRRPRQSLAALTHCDLIARTVPGFRNALYGFGLVLLAGTIALALRRPEYVPYFAGIGLAAIAAIFCWFGGAHKGLPFMAVFVIQQAAVYLMPLFVENQSLEGYPPGVVSTSAASSALFLLLLPAGWYWGIRTMRSKPSRWNLTIGGRDGGRAKAMAIALTLLSIGFVFQLISFTGGIFSMLPGGAEGLFPLLRTCAAACSTLGALLGGYAVGSRGGTSRSTSYWLLLAGIAVFSIAGVLLSAVTALAVGATIGLALGGRRMPWLFLGTTLGLMGFLNLGKFTMRERYWNEGNSTGMTLIQLPGFYAEWAAASVEKINAGQAAAEGQVVAEEDKGQSLLDRINNYQNMVFVVNAQRTLGMRPMWGETYALIPPLFVPRILWPGKPRTHEGQVRLNLHYGRQISLEQTEKTYIAWGLLPEAVGNFGVWLGPAILGPVLGFLFGLLEAWSRRKRLFSIEGLIGLSLLLAVLVSFEMAASVFLTSAFQMVVAVSAGGALLRAILSGGGRPATGGRR